MLIHVINPQSFNWTMTTRLPVTLMLSVITALSRGFGDYRDACGAAGRFNRRRARGKGRLVIRAASLSLAAWALTQQRVSRRRRAFTYPDVKPGRVFSFPADHGAHPDFRTEWWYVTGTVKTANGKDLGFQITFFRTRPRVDPRNPSKFTPRQILFAHAAVSDSFGR